MKILTTIRHDNQVFLPGDEARFISHLDQNPTADDDAFLTQLHDRGLIHAEFAAVTITLPSAGPSNLDALTNDAAGSPTTNDPVSADDVSVSVSAPGTDEGRPQSGGDSDGADQATGLNATEGAIELADAHGIDLSTVAGTGLGGRIIIADVKKLID